MEHNEEQSIEKEVINEDIQMEEGISTMNPRKGQTPENVLPTKTLNSLFVHSREVVLYVANNERTTVEAISDSISTYGYTPDEFTSGKLSLREIIYPEDFYAAAGYINEQLKKGTASFDLDFRIVAKSGCPVWVTCAILPEYDTEWVAIHFLVKIKDISRRKNHEYELQDANENLLVTLQSIGEAVILIDPCGNINRLNGVAEKLVGIMNPKAKSKPMSEVIHFSRSEDFTNLVNPLETTEEKFKLMQFNEIFMQCVNSGNQFRVSCNVSPIYVGKDKSTLSGYVLVVKDLTNIYRIWQNSKTTEIRMQESENTLRGIFDHSADGLVIAYHNGIIKEWSSGYERITGISKETAIGKNLWDVVAATLPPEQRTGEESAKLQSELKSALTGMLQKMISRHVIHQQTGERKILQVFYFPVSVTGQTMVAAISRDVTDLHNAQQNLIAEKNRLLALGDHFPDGCLFRMEIDPTIHKVSFSYLSKTWEKLTNTTVEEAMSDIGIPFSKIHPDDLKQLTDGIWGSIGKQAQYSSELRYFYTENEMRWLQTSAHRHEEDGHLVSDGFILDITDRKEAEMKLAAYQEELEIMVKERTEELEITNEELYATNEELYATNEEYAVTNEELNQYRTRLEEMVETKTQQQNILIKILQIVQSSENIPEALNISLGEIGKYTGVSRSYIFETDADKMTVSNTFEWCNEGVPPAIDTLQEIPVSNLQDWFDTFNAGRYIRSSDVSTLSPYTAQVLKEQGILSILVIPLTANGVNYGFVGFDDCQSYRKWAQSEIDLLISLSQIISTATRRQRAEASMRQSEEMYRQLTVASPDAVAVFSPKGNIRFVSSRAMELFGVRTDSDIRGLRMQKFVHPHDRRQAYTLFRMMVRDNISFLPQILLMRMDGSEFFGEISSATVKNTDDQTTSIIMVIRDVTQRKMAEAELIQAKEKAEESDKLKSAFLANMSHEIRTPLNGIVGFLNFLSSDNLSSSRRQNYIKIINNSSTQLVKLIDDIIDIAKIEARQMNIHPVPFHVNELMSELQVFFDTYLQSNKKGRIALLLDDNLFIDQCVIFVDPVRLRQVLNNLISNAIKFTEKGYIRFGYRQCTPNSLEFVVEDSGIGLGHDQLEIIFERFRQAELNNNRRYGGTGLGLTISRSLVQLMGGEIRVESTEGAGSSFYFTISYLPVAPADEQLFDNPAGTSSDTLFRNKTVLMVEPEIMTYKYYEKLLSATGASVIHATNLRQWLTHIGKNSQIDIVIASISAFDNVDSDTIIQIRAVRAGLPLVLIAPPQKSDCWKIISDSRCDMTLPTPVNYDKLLEVLKKYIGKR